MEDKERSTLVEDTTISLMEERTISFSKKTLLVNSLLVNFETKRT